MRIKCQECLKVFDCERKSRKFCSGACRSAAHYQRHNDAKQFTQARGKRTLQNEIDIIAEKSASAGKCLTKMALHASAETMNLAIKAVMDALLQVSNVYFDYDEGVWTNA